ncbi:MAG TPA: hypothetical protein VG986_02560 [Pseudolabrys sp.]|nr:hypothetical protein [Pseudolabrys sp.]
MTPANLLRSTAAALALIAGLGLATQVSAREHERHHEKIDKVEKVQKLEKAQKVETEKQKTEKRDNKRADR